MDDRKEGTGDRFHRLRQLAVQAVTGRPVHGEPLSPQDADRLLYELQVHQMELEMQNEELLRTQRELESARDGYADLYDFAPVGYFTINDEGRIVEVNLTGVRLLGTEKTRVLGKPFSRFVAREEKDTLYLHHKKMVESGELQTCELQLTKGDGTTFFASLESIVLSSGEDGGGAVWRTVVSDVTERRQAREALQQAHDTLEERVAERTEQLSRAVATLEREVAERREAEGRLELTAKVFDNTNEAIVITDRANRIVDVNAAFTRITQYPPGEALGQDPGFMKSGRHDRAFYSAMWHALWKEGRWQGEIWDRRKNGEVYPKWLTIDTVRDEQGEITHCIGVFSDISTLKTAEERLEHLAFHDTLTGLPNRHLFRNRLEHELNGTEREKRKIAVLFIDLDNFKDVNDTLGHAVGDQLLVEMARRIQGCVREEDTVARMGGDEFTVILSNIDRKKGLVRAVNAALEAIRAPVRIDGHDITAGASIGIAIHPDDGKDFTTLTKNADAAMYQAKENGRNSFEFYRPEIQAAAMQRLAMEQDLRNALEQDEFHFHFQPLVDLHGGKVTGMEALLRWRNAKGENIPPDAFIPVAEETGLIVPLGLWGLRTACGKARIWADRGHDDFRVAVNLSVRQFRQGSLADTVRRTLEETGLAAQFLELEVTESMVMENMDLVVGSLQELREMGVHISMDDFGTGYSSLSHLKRLPIHTLKIDRSFVRDLTTDPDDRAIVLAIISLAHNLNLKVVAEGVENPAQLEFLKKNGCDVAQGYLFSRPLPAEDFGGFLKGNDHSWGESES